MHIGEKVKARAKELRIGPTELARKIKTSKQNIYGIYTRASIDTALLQKLSKALEFDFFAYFTSGSNHLVHSPQTNYAKKKKNFISVSDDAASLQKELNELREKYELLRALYEAKTGKKAPGS
ncbi:MAG: hypothetical protein HY064_10930 [Bacteroidetes bacterium]|nr:hypothetical protein [Bacteroidota bacterium]